MARDGDAKARPGGNPAAWPLSPESHGTVGTGKSAAFSHPGRNRRRFKRRLLWDGRLVRLRARSLRRLARDWRTTAAACRTKSQPRLGARSKRRVVPAPGRRFHRPRSVAPCGAHLFVVIDVRKTLTRRRLTRTEGHGIISRRLI